MPKPLPIFQRSKNDLDHDAFYLATGTLAGADDALARIANHGWVVESGKSTKISNTEAKKIVAFEYGYGSWKELRKAYHDTNRDHGIFAIIDI